MARRHLILWWLAFFLSFGSTAHCQQRVEGKIVDKETGKPIPFASLALEGTSMGTSANENGQFSIVITEPFTIKVTCVGYETKVIRLVEDLAVIQLKAIATQLNTVYVLNKAINPNKIVRKAFAAIADNYDAQSFLQNFFYRHYTRTDSTYETLIEASIDVWKHNGYESSRRSAGENEEVRVLHLRRSLDIKGMVQGQRPLFIGNILESDIAAYQTREKKYHVDFFERSSNLKTDFNNYHFMFDGITTYDGVEVYKIDYSHKKDSVLTKSGYKIMPMATGSLYITTQDYAFVKTDEIKYDDYNTLHTTAHYRKLGTKYYPYHFIRQGQSFYIAQRYTSYHIELISQDVGHGAHDKFKGQEPDRDALLKIPYDSTFWNNASILKTTPLEDDIIRDLGGGASLDKQFFLYRQYELNVTDGGVHGEEKFNWLKEDSKGKRILYICFWDNRIKDYLLDLEYLKQLNLLYKNKVMFVMISREQDEAKWQQQIVQYNLFSDGIVNYRVGESDSLLKLFQIKSLPAFILISKDGEVNLNPKGPRDPMLEADLKKMIESY